MNQTEAKQIEEILQRRANEIAAFRTEFKEKLASVDFACEREVNRLRALAEAVIQPFKAETEDD